MNHTQPFLHRHFAFLVLLLILLLSPNRLHAQSYKPFPTDTTGFAEAFRSFMTVTRLNEHDMALLEDFISRVSSDSATVTPEKRDLIIHTLNRMKSRKARPVPFITDYMETFIFLEDHYAGKDYFDTYEKGLLSLLNNRKLQMRRLQQFISEVKNFLLSRQLHTSRATTWATDSVPFRFEFDSLFYIVPAKTRLMCRTTRDSILIRDAVGRYAPFASLWLGKEGRVTWQRAGYAADSVYVILRDYRINLSMNGYKLDSVQFINKSYFKEPILGHFEDKVSHISSPARATYPRFSSYVKRFRIKNLYPEVDYEGGFAMQGAIVNGTGNPLQLASVRFFRKDTLRLLVKSVFFAIHKDHISSREASITFFLGKDSIYHPNIAFNFNDPTHEVSLYQTDNLMTTSPYYDSYHNLNISANRFVWKKDNDQALFTRLRGTTIGEARFWSTNFFNDQTYYKIQYMDEQHPLYLLKKFADWYYADDFPVSDLADWLKKPEYQVRRMVVNLAILGFVFYNPETGEVVLKKELYDYLDAHAHKIDYDVMSFFSRTRAPLDNAILDLKSYDMTINGVPTIFLSDSQDVSIYPAGNRIIMHRNRSFSFDGQVKAGMSMLYGKKFMFSYDSFRIQMNKIDSMKFMAYGDKVDDLGNPVPEKINNILEVVTGDIYIDKPDNKSGRHRYPQYPFFRSTDSSYVFYDEASIYDTIYNRKDFYFVIEPFTLYKLNKLRKENLTFKGDFVSGSIFPPIPQQLKVQEDNSLGFVSDIPQEGINVYDGKGRYFDKVHLSNQGLSGAGKLEYLTATLQADTFIFFPDSMLTIAHQFTLDTAMVNGKQFPSVSATDVDVHWYPHRDEMHILRKKDDPVLYGAYPLNGNILLTPEELTATGVITFPRMAVHSTQFRLQPSRITADTSRLTFLAEGNQQKKLLEASAVSMVVDVTEKTAQYECLNDTLPVSLPEKRWITSLDHIVVDYDKGIAHLTNEKSLDDQYLLFKDPLKLSERWQKPPTFIALLPKADTLGFSSDSAVYDLKSNILSAYHTEYIEVADALVYPDSMVVHINPGGYLANLDNARMVANQKYTFDSVSLKIISRHDFTGSGNYHYLQDNGEAETIFFSKIYVDDSTFTRALTRIPEENHFMLSPVFEYTGTVELFSHHPHLLFSGGVKIQHTCEGLPRHFFTFSSEINPDTIFIPVGDDLRDIHRKKLYLGHMITNDSTHIYPTFLSPRKHYSDVAISTAHGVLYFDKASGQYRIGSREKVLDPALPGNYLSLDKNYCRLYGEGLLNLNVDLGQVKIITVGSIQQDMEKDSVTLDVMIGFDFFFHPGALKVMQSEIDSLANLPPVDVRSDNYRKMLEELPAPGKQPVAEEKGKKKPEEIKLFTQFKSVPPAQKHTIFLSKVHLIWHQDTRSFISEGKIGIGNIDGYPLNVMTDGYLEIQRRRSGSSFDLYLQPTDRLYYYFAYTTGVMQAIARNRQFMNLLMQEKESKRIHKGMRGGPSYMYMPGVNRKMSMFLRKMEMLQEEQNTGDNNPER